MYKYEHMCTHIHTQVYALKFTQKSMHIFTYIQSHISLICRYTHTHTCARARAHTLTHALTLLDLYTIQTLRYTYLFTLAHMHI